MGVEAAQLAARSASLRALLARQLGERRRLYAAVDAARDEELVRVARRLRYATRWLFSDGAGLHLVGVAPYLIEVGTYGRGLPQDSPYLSHWARRLGSGAGILLATPVGPKGLWEHLRTVFRVKTEDGHRYYFRFYDPRVLRAFLPVCSGEEAAQLLGPIEAIFLEGRRAGTMLCCRSRPAGFALEETVLWDAAADSVIA